MNEYLSAWFYNLSWGEQIFMEVIISAAIGAVASLIVGYFTYLGKMNDVLKNTENGGTLSKEHDGLSKEHNNRSKEHDRLSQEHDKLSEEHRKLESDLSKINGKMQDLWTDASNKNMKAELMSKDQEKIIDGLRAAERSLFNFTAEKERMNAEIAKLKDELYQEKLDHTAEVSRLNEKHKLEMENAKMQIQKYRNRLEKYEPDRDDQER